MIVAYLNKCNSDHIYWSAVLFLMQKLGIQGVWRGKNKKTTRSRDDQKRADDLGLVEN